MNEISETAARPATAPIVVGTDGSPAATQAVRWASREAALRDRPLRIVHAVEQWIYEMPMFPPPGTIDSLKESGRAILAEAEKVARATAPGIAVSTRMVAESTVAALREESAEAFETVVGHRGLGGFTSLLLGSTGLRVAGQVAGPVVIVRGAGEGVPDPADRGEITVGVDLSDASKVVLEHAFETAAAHGARLRIVNAYVLSPTLLQAGYALDLSDVDAQTREQLRELCAPWRTAYPQVKVGEEVHREHPVTVLTEASKTSDLLIVGAHGRGAIGALLLGSVSHGVVHHAHCPVTVVRPRPTAGED